jgi:hypothetical protein
MQQNLKLNLHGVVGILFVLLMFGIAFVLHWNINWWYFVIALVLYSGAIILLTRAEEKGATTETGQLLIFRCLLGCHFALLFLAVGLLIHFPNYTLFGYHGSDNDIKPSYFVASVVGGLAIPFLLLRISQNKIALNTHGVIGMLLIILMFGIAFFYSWNITWWYFIGAIALYTGTSVVLNLRSEVEPPGTFFRARLGWHLAFIFLLVGFGFHFQDGGINLGFFIASIAGGLVIPYLLFR